MNRRCFLKTISLAAGSLALRPSILLAQSSPLASGKNLIIINCLGGVDGLSMCPYYEGGIADLLRNTARKDLALPAIDVIKPFAQTGISDKVGLHPGLAKLSEVAAANLKIMQKYGVPDDLDRSHDSAQLRFSLGNTNIGGAVQGVLAKLMDQENYDSFQYWAFGGNNLTDVNTFKQPPIAASNLNDFDYGQIWWESQNDKDLGGKFEQELLEIAMPKTPIGDEFKSAGVAMHRSVGVIRRDILNQVVGNNTAGNYTGNGIGSNLRDAAKVLKTGSNRNRIIYAGMGGFDTHSDQNQQIPKLLFNLGNNLAVFAQDLKNFGQWNNSTVMVISEFGRTIFQNGPGTDHGWGNNTFVMGGSITGGVMGNAPTPQEIMNDRNALVSEIDFRDVWGDLFQWLGVAPESILAQPNYSYRTTGIYS